MTVHRRALGVLGVAAASALVFSACSSTSGNEAPPSPTAARPVGAPPATTTMSEAPTPTSTTVDVPSGLIGDGCEWYVERVPAGPGSVVGMAVDPVAVAIQNSPLLTTLGGALAGRLNSEVDLADTLNKGEYTVFAPTDDAFGKVDPALIEKFKGDPELLTSVLKYHVIQGELDTAAVVGDHTTLQGRPLTVTQSGGGLRVNDAGVVCGGIKTANATVYLLDTVLTVPAPQTPSTSGSPTDGESTSSTETTATPTP